jgi:hypothetical protein
MAAERQSETAQGGTSPMWRITAYLKRAPGLAREDFVARWDSLSRRMASRDRAARPDRIVMNLPLDPPVSDLIAMFGDRYDGVAELWFRSREDAIRILLDLEADPGLREASAELLDTGACSRWLAEVRQVIEAPGTGVRFFVAGQQVDSLTVKEAQRYWHDVHPVVFRAVDDFMAYITRYIQMHGSDAPELVGTTLLGRYDFYPMCADMGLREPADVPIAYALDSYMALVRPDELKFSKQGEMLSFASTRRIVLA